MLQIFSIPFINYFFGISWLNGSHNIHLLRSEKKTTRTNPMMHYYQWKTSEMRLTIIWWIVNPPYGYYCPWCECSHLDSMPCTLLTISDNNKMAYFFVSLTSLQTMKLQFLQIMNQKTCLLLTQNSMCISILVVSCCSCCDQYECTSTLNEMNSREVYS